LYLHVRTEKFNDKLKKIEEDKKTEKSLYCIETYKFDIIYLFELFLYKGYILFDNL
jgi:hypothetical protein